MIYDILIDDKVIPELTAIAFWYTRRSDTAAEKFETALNWVLETLRTDIIDYSSFTEHIKRAPVPDFPYFVYYSRNKEILCVHIHAILHTKRGPDFLFQRLYE